MAIFKKIIFTLVVLAGVGAIAQPPEPRVPNQGMFKEVICRQEDDSFQAFLYLFGGVGILGRAPSNSTLKRALEMCLYFPTSVECISGSAARAVDSRIRIYKVALFTHITQQGQNVFGSGNTLDLSGQPSGLANASYGRSNNRIAATIAFGDVFNPVTYLFNRCIFPADDIIK